MFIAGACYGNVYLIAMMVSALEKKVFINMMMLMMNAISDCNDGNKSDEDDDTSDNDVDGDKY